jgi:serine/threonine protein kinase
LIQGRYLVVHLIGKGGMGEVYLAIDQRLGHPVALKRTVFADDDTMGSAFEREARTLARLRHPALPKVSDHFAENGNQYLVMEHIAGDDLGQRLTSMKAPFPLDWVLFWADQLLEALNYLHSNEPPILHRDIKPQNLKLTDDNNIILLDFGLSKSGLGSSPDPVSGGSGSVLGYTPHFAPMEQVRGTGTNPRSDIYSLSATLYQLLGNVCPADALTRADAMLGGSPDPLPSLSDINPEVPRPISDVVAKGMAVSQEQRYASAREMQRSLRDAYSNIQSDMGAQTMIMDSPMGGTVAPSPPSSSDSGWGAPSMEDSQDSLPTQPRQADLKTEVFHVPGLAGPGDSSGVTADGEPVVTAPIGAGSYGADATLPAVKLAAEMEEAVQPAPPSPLASGIDRGVEPGAEGIGAKGVEAVDAEPAKKSKGFLLAVLGGLVLIGLLMVGGLVGAFYYLNPASDYSEEAEAPEPSPSSEPSPEPTFAATPEESDSTTTSDGPADSEPTPEPSPIATPEPRVSPVPTPATRPTQRPTQRPTPRPQPQPQPQPSRPPRQIPQ